MSMLRHAAAVVAALALAPAGAAAAQQTGYPQRLGIGTTPTPQDLAKETAIPPDGRGLPPGQGTYAEGQQIFAQVCSACHGDKLQGNPTPGLGGDKLIGGRGTLASNAPVKTVESYWPYATTLFDYIRRAMPLSSPGALDDHQVYAVTAYILGEANIIPKTAVMNAKTLPAVQMPNRDGFVPDPRPEIELYR
ncbi:MAG TPA: cytochrome c [Stellaceae bacterium]|nr:cytochrome c [Stellaceae bacterium]